MVVASLSSSDMAPPPGVSSLALTGRSIKPTFNTGKFVGGLVCAVVPGLVYLYLHQSFKTKIEKIAKKVIHRIQSSLGKDISYTIRSCAQAKKKINEVPFRLRFRILGINPDSIKMSLMIAIAEQATHILGPESSNDDLEHLQAELEKTPRKESQEYQDAKKFIDGLILLKQAFNGDVPLILIPKDQAQEMELPLTSCRDPIQEFSFDELEEEPSTDLDSEPSPEPISEPVSPIPEPAPEPLPPVPASPTNQFLEQLKQSECIHSRELFWSLFLGMKVDHAAFNPETGEFEITLDQSYTVHLASIKKTKQNIQASPGPHAPQLKFDQVIKGKISKAETAEQIEFQNCLTGSGHLPIVGRKEMRLDAITMAIVIEPGKTNAQFKLPYVGNQSVPIDIFRNVLDASCVLPAPQLCERNRTLSIGDLRKQSLLVG